MDDKATLKQAAWNAYIDLVYGLLRAIIDGERYEGELQQEWSLVWDRARRRDLGSSNANAVSEP